MPRITILRMFARRMLFAASNQPACTIAELSHELLSFAGEPRLRFTHSFNTYKLQGRDQVVLPRRKFLQTPCANLWSRLASRAGAQSPSPVATFSPSLLRIQYSHGNVK